MLHYIPNNTHGIPLTIYTSFPLRAVVTYCRGVLYCKSSMDKLWRRKNCKTCVNATCIEGERCVVHVLKFPLVVPTGVVLGRRY